MIQRFLKWMQVDSTLLFALAARMWQIVAGPVTLGLILYAFTLPEQGIYYTLIGLVALQNLFELGYFSYLISRVGRIADGLSDRSAGTASSPLRQDSLLGINGLLKVAQRWMAAVSTAFAATAVTVGCYVLHTTRDPIPWLAPMLVFIAFNAATFFLTHRIAVLEGAGERAAVYRLQMFQSFSGSLVNWTALLIGFKLWALCATAGLQLLWTVCFTVLRPPAILREIRQAQGGRVSSAESSLLAGQSWIAVYSLAQFLSNQLFVVLIMRFHGEEEAGRIGISLMAVNAVQMVAMAWLQTKYAPTAVHQGAGRTEVAGLVWRKAVVVSTLVLGVLLFDLVIGLFLVAWFFPGVEQRFISPVELTFLGIGCLAHHLIAAQTFYAMSLRSRPLTRAAVVGFLSAALAVLSGAYWFANLGAVIGYSVAMTLFALPIHTWAYGKLRRE